MKEILIATNNQGKVKEIKEILKDYKLLTLKDVNCQIEVEEDGKTFEENAIKKAREISKITNLPCIADDSGICIEILDNWPGVHTARFLGKEATAQERNQAILDRLKDKHGTERNVKFVCVIAYASNDKVFTTKGEISGKIANKPKGKNGFGFDSIFELDSGKTLAELTDKEKNNLSSRKLALEKLKEKLENM